jgi:glycosyltransferase involved in cell wall biosynthesis
MAGSEFRLDQGPDWQSSSAHLDHGVTVILRTKDRPIFLRRALASVAAQEYPDLTLCIINDGGDRATVEALVQSCLPPNIDREIVNHDNSHGQPGALNAGFARVRRQFFTVHDDDDSWAPSFLKKMVAFLQEPYNKRFIAAVCLADQVVEIVRNGEIERKSQRPYALYPPVLPLIDFLHPPIHPPPISQLMRHAALKIAGPMNIELPVMYDFEWTIRLLRQADVATLPETLAFYHFRAEDRGVEEAARNSVFTYSQDYDRLRALLHNQLLREEMSKGHFDLGIVSNLVYLHYQIQSRVDAGLSDQVIAYLRQRARQHARKRRMMRRLEAPLRYLRKLLG